MLLALIMLRLLWRKIQTHFSSDSSVTSLSLSVMTVRPLSSVTSCSYYSIYYEAIKRISSSLRNSSPRRIQLAQKSARKNVVCSPTDGPTRSDYKSPLLKKKTPQPDHSKADASARITRSLKSEKTHALFESQYDISFSNFCLPGRLINEMDD